MSEDAMITLVGTVVILCVLAPLFWMAHGRAFLAWVRNLRQLLQWRGDPLVLHAGAATGDGHTTQRRLGQTVVETELLDLDDEVEIEPIVGQVYVIDSARHDRVTEVWERTPFLRPITSARDLIEVPRPPLDTTGVDEKEEENVLLPHLVPPVEHRSTMPVPVEAIRLRREDYQFTIGTQGGRPVYFSLGHGGVFRATGSGKSNIVGIVTGQAVASGINVWYINCAYASIDEDGLDVSPIINRCAVAAVEPSGEQQLFALRRARNLVDERAIEAAAGKRFFDPVLIVVEELKALTDRLRLFRMNKVPGFEQADTEAMSLISILLSSGRKYNVNLFVVAQDGQSRSTGISEGSYVNLGFRIFHPSLDSASMRKLLPAQMRGKPERHKLPKVVHAHQWYLVRVGSSGVEELSVLDVPLLTNEDVQAYVAGIPELSKPGDPVAPPLAEAWATDVSRVAAARLMAEIAEQTPDTHLGESPVIPNAVPITRAWSPDHIKAAFWLASTPADKQSNRQLAQYLFENPEGRYNVKAGIILDEVRSLVCAGGTVEHAHQESDSDSHTENTPH